MQKALIDKLRAVGAGRVLFHQKMEQVSTLEEWLCCQGRREGRGADEPEAGPPPPAPSWGGQRMSAVPLSRLLHLYWSFCWPFPFQLTLAPRFLPSALISVDFAANYLTKIYGLTFGQKPNLRSEARGMIRGVWGCTNVGRVWKV